MKEETSRSLLLIYMKHLIQVTHFLNLIDSGLLLLHSYMIWWWQALANISKLWINTVTVFSQFVSQDFMTVLFIHSVLAFTLIL